MNVEIVAIIDCQKCLKGQTSLGLLFESVIY